MRLRKDGDSGQHEVRQFVVPRLDTPPDVPVQGEIYFDTVLGYFRGWDGAAWQAMFLPKPAAPRGFSANDATGEVQLSWTVVPLATSYNIYRSEVSGEEELLVEGVVTANGTYNDDSGIVSTLYYFKVTAVNQSGESDLSLEVSGTPQP